MTAPTSLHDLPDAERALLRRSSQRRCGKDKCQCQNKTETPHMNLSDQSSLWQVT